MAMLRHKANSNRQEVTGNLTDSLSWVRLRKDLAAQNWNTLCFSALILPKRRLRAESSLQRLCALICADKAGVWARKKVERDREAAEASSQWATCTLLLLIRTERAFIDLLYTACVTFPGKPLPLRKSLKTWMPGHFDIVPPRMRIQHVYGRTPPVFFFFFSKKCVLVNCIALDSIQFCKPAILLLAKGSAHPASRDYRCVVWHWK